MRNHHHLKQGRHLHKAGSKAKISSSKRVQFFPSVRMVAWQSTEDNGERWYTKEAYQSFKQEVRQTTQAVVQYDGDFDSLNPKEHCLVGLEDRITKDQIRNRKRRTREYTYIVLHSQHRLRCLGIDDPEWISAIASQVSRHARHQAFERAAVYQSCPLQRILQRIDHQLHLNFQTILE